MVVMNAYICEWKNTNWVVITITSEDSQLRKVTSEETEHKPGSLWRELARKAKSTSSWPSLLPEGTLQEKIMKVSDSKDTHWMMPGSWEHGWKKGSWRPLFRETDSLCRQSDRNTVCYGSSSYRLIIFSQGRGPVGVGREDFT